MAALPVNLLSLAEISEITGYVQPCKQVEELKRQGFWRARRNPAGAVVLERAHYEAVCAGATQGISGRANASAHPGAFCFAGALILSTSRRSASASSCPRQHSTS